ncbi:DUF7437 domain-containing protein [Halovivax cerinus]|uniref:DUF7437 domain-containing protein n=1 Tax=Halovivax cerinus TaxID=1487865 RepID=UPI003CCD6B9B
MYKAQPVRGDKITGRNTRSSRSLNENQYLGCRSEQILLGQSWLPVYGAVELDDIELFVERNGKPKLSSAIAQTIEYLRGNRSHRGAADAPNVPAVEGIAITQATEIIDYLM